MKKKVRLSVCLLIGMIMSFCVLADDWQVYKQQYITPEGRVQDTGNNDISHSEGQGYGMLLALEYGDKKTFEQLWQWSKKQLGREDLPLFAWKYDPHSYPHVVDHNNASDGDLLIAWALLEAGKTWHSRTYLNASRRIRRAILEHLLINYAGFLLLLPGIQGFTGNGYIDVNLSYWVMPALSAFAAEGEDPRWQQLITSAERLLQASRFGDDELPSDWQRVNAQGAVYPSPNWPPRFGFDAVRILLYFYWAGMGQSKALEPIKHFWLRSKGRPPAWVDVHTGVQAPYLASAGVMAISQMMTSRRPDTLPITANMDYYSASLLLLTRLALQRP